MTFQVTIPPIEVYKEININKDNTTKKDRYYCVTNPNYTIKGLPCEVLYGSSIQILKRKIDKFLKRCLK